MAGVMQPLLVMQLVHYLLLAIGEGEGFRFDVDIGQFAGEEVGYSSHEGSITHIAEGNSLLGLKEVFWELNGCLGIGKG